MKRAKRTRDCILEFLQSSRYTAKDLHKALKGAGISVTYQAVHKLLKKMEREGIVARKDRQFDINRDWIEKTEDIIKNVKESREMISASMPNFKDLKAAKSQFKTCFNSLSEADKYRISLTHQFYAIAGEKPPFVMVDRHLKSAIVHGEDIIKVIHAAKRTGMMRYCVVNYDTPVDRAVANLYKKDRLIKIKLGVKKFMERQLYVMDDVVMEIEIPAAVKKAFDKEFRKAKHISDINFPEFYRNVMQKKAKIKCLIYRNRFMADDIRRRVMKEFGDVPEKFA